MNYPHFSSLLPINKYAPGGRRCHNATDSPNHAVTIVVHSQRGLAELTEKIQGSLKAKTYPRNGNQKHKKIFLPFQGSQPLLPSMILFIYMPCCLLGEPMGKRGHSKHCEFTWHRFICFRD